LYITIIYPYFCRTTELLTKLHSDLMFRVVTGGFSQEFERWIDAVHTANFLKPNCKSWLEDIRVFDL
jgi:hypothetical protein